MTTIVICKICKRDAPDNKCCGGCKLVFYCSAVCQKADWPAHKKICKMLLNAQVAGFSDEQKLTLQATEIESGRMIFHYLNKRSDRTITDHGNDTYPAQGPSSHLNRLLALMALPKAEKMVVLDDYCGVYGRCVHDCESLVAVHGGDLVHGWSVFEGTYMMEAEYHSVWRPPKIKDRKRRLVNVTPLHGTTQPYEGIFIVDPQAYEIRFVIDHTAPSRVLWK